MSTASTKANQSIANPAVGSESCAREVIETVPMVARFIGAKMRGNLQVSMPQLKVLTFIGRHPGTSLSSAAEDLAVAAATASGLVDRLVKRGYVTRVEDPRERRKVLLNLTSAGAEHLENCWQFAQTSIAGLLAELPPAKLAKIKDGLAILKEAFREVP